MIFEIFCWIGVILLFTAYILVSSSKIKAKDLSYQFLNLIGGGFIVLNGWYLHSWSIVAFNLCWMAIAIRIIYKNIVGRKIWRS